MEGPVIFPDLLSLKEGRDYVVISYVKQPPILDGMNSLLIWLNATNTDMLYSEYIASVEERKELSHSSGQNEHFDQSVFSLHTYYKIIFNKSGICLESIYLNNKVKFAYLVNYFHRVCLGYYNKDVTTHKGDEKQILRVMFRGNLTWNSIFGIEYWTDERIEKNNVPKCYFTMDTVFKDKRHGSVEVYSHGSFKYSVRSEKPPGRDLYSIITSTRHPPYRCLFIKEVIYLGRQGERLSDQAHIIYLDTAFRPIYNPNRPLDWRPAVPSILPDNFFVKRSYIEMFHYGRYHTVAYPALVLPAIPTPNEFNDFGLPNDKINSMLINDRIPSEVSTTDTNQEITTVLQLPEIPEGGNNNKKDMTEEVERIIISNIVSKEKQDIKKEEEDITKNKDIQKEEEMSIKPVDAISEENKKKEEVITEPLGAPSPHFINEEDGEISELERPSKRQKTKRQRKAPERYSARLDLKNMKEVVSLLKVLKDKLAAIHDDTFKEALKAIDERFKTNL